MTFQSAWDGDTLQCYTATTGFAGISTDAAVPLSKAASVLSRVFSILASPSDLIFIYVPRPMSTCSFPKDIDNNVSKFDENA